MTKIFAHRGSKGTHPENTLPAFKEAINIGADGIELDVQLTKDQKLVVIHDNTVDRTTDGSGEITDFTLEELKGLDAGSWFNSAFKGERIPTFDEVLACLIENGFKGILNIEVKTDEKDYPGIEEILVNRLRERAYEFTIWYSSFNFTTLETLHRLDPERPLAYIMYDNQNEMAMVKYIPFIKAVHPKKTVLSNDAHELRTYPLPLRPWTINSEDDLRVAFTHKIAGVHTDYPETALQIRESIVGKEDNDER